MSYPPYRTTLAFGADPDRKVVPLNLRGRVKLLAVTCEIGTAAGAAPAVSIRLTDKSRNDDSAFDVDLLTDDTFGAVETGRRVGWVADTDITLDPETANLAVLARDFNGGTLNVIVLYARP